AIESLYYKDIFSQNIPVIEYQCITDFSLTPMPPAGLPADRQGTSLSSTLSLNSNERECAQSAFAEAARLPPACR
ncbi:MAG: hypothetical protein JXA72_12115, partial [Bacteroidales bacterium]|nr:hypothetical protein [Bacteroidales bacterium]